MAVKFTEEQLNTLDKSLIIQLLISQQQRLRINSKIEHLCL